METNVPKVGDDVYLDSSLFLFHGRDDFIGGLCKVSSVVWDDTQSAHFIAVEEKPGTTTRWENHLERKQGKHKKNKNRDARVRKAREREALRQPVLPIKQDKAEEKNEFLEKVMNIKIWDAKQLSSLRCLQILRRGIWMQ